MFEAMIGQAPEFEALIRNAKVVAATDVTVLITGETGTGKEMLAAGLREHSPRADKHFITLNCAALPEAIADSELFGHQKGAFTDAVIDQLGRLQAADGGTLLLDEVDSLPLPSQAKLLRFLETGEIQPVGATYAQHVNVRIIAATNVSLGEKIARGEFRKDFYYRLSIVPLEIPPLRKRKGDIPLLLNHFIASFASKHMLPPARIAESALSLLCAYRWPGNVRELRNLCERLVILRAGRVIEERNLPDEIAGRARSHKSPFTLPEFGMDLRKLEIDLIRQALDRTNGNRSRSARLLGISRDTLLYRMQKYGLK